MSENVVSIGLPPQATFEKINDELTILTDFIGGNHPRRIPVEPWRCNIM